MESKQHMLEGIARMNKGDWLAALRHFENAVELREAMPWRDDAESAWVLAAAWINRSDVLRFLDRTEEGVHSLDRAIEAMAHVPLDKGTGYADRLILAWINRGTACGEIGRMAESLAGFSKAQELLETWGGPVTPGRCLMASMLHANRAKVLLDLGRTIGGWRSAQIAVDFLRDLESSAAVAEASIKSRGILCHALAMLLDEPNGAELAKDWIAIATDSTEEALTLVRATGYRGAWIADLVRYGAKIYRFCQPHFLGEFIREWTTGDGPLADDELLRREMANELLLAKADLEQRVMLYPHKTDYVERAMKTLRSIQNAESGLAAIHP
jgi:hypothetical protein